ncbi:PdxS/SNZ N-terminal domain [Dillenia turbinata]|uniref:pyridoxal 5'-phosphate synthase (glutamine hydrolyzing) n=1 Tax=Dillenia turbinata TaxID=194707 RepID=A0AAN8USZ0_9MAGN
MLGQEDKGCLSNGTAIPRKEFEFKSEKLGLREVFTVRLALENYRGHKAWRSVMRDIRVLWNMDDDEVFTFAKKIVGPYDLMMQMKQLGRLPIVHFAIDDVATLTDAALMMQLDCDGVFVGSGVLKIRVGAYSFVVMRSDAILNCDIDVTVSWTRVDLSNQSSALRRVLVGISDYVRIRETSVTFVLCVPDHKTPNIN